MTARAKVITMALLVSALAIEAKVIEAAGAAESRGEAAGYEWYQAKADEWKAQARTLRTLQVAFVAVAVVSSILAASRFTRPAWWPEWLLPVIAAVAVALFAGLDINTQANKQRHAWRHLTTALAAYRDDPRTTLDPVRKAYGEAEEILGDYDPQVRK